MNNPVLDPSTAHKRVEVISNSTGSPIRNWSPDVPIPMPDADGVKIEPDRITAYNPSHQAPLDPLQSNRSSLQAEAKRLPSSDMPDRLRFLIEEVLNPGSS